MAARRLHQPVVARFAAGSRERVLSKPVLTFWLMAISLKLFGLATATRRTTAK